MDPILAQEPTQTELEQEAEAKQHLIHDLQNKLDGHAGVVTQLKDALQKERDEKALLAKQLHEVTQQLERVNSDMELPPLEEAEIKVFTLQNVQAEQAAQTVASLLGRGPVRVAIDERTNALIVAGKGESLTIIEALLLRLDEQAQAAAQATESAPTAAGARSLMLRTFWLADGLPEGEGQDPAKFLPESVLGAVAQLGLDESRLVAQTVNALSRDADPGREAPFSTSIPALIFKQPVHLAVSGKVFPVRDGRAELEVRIAVTGPMINAELAGSLATPLGHYMVLGTANSVSGNAAAMQGAGMMGMGMEGGGYGRGGYGGEMGAGGYGGGEYGRGGADGEARGGGYGGDESGDEAVDPVTGLPVGADGNPLPAAERKFDASHFAFVVQVIEAESFADEE